MILCGCSGYRFISVVDVIAGNEEAHVLSDYARHFQLPEQEVMDGRASSICVVHHDEHGRIIRIDSQPR